jgi:hypothetical protein
MTTNGIALHRKLPGYVNSGLTHINISLDTLDEFKFELMTRRRGLRVFLCVPATQKSQLRRPVFHWQAIPRFWRHLNTHCSFFRLLGNCPCDAAIYIQSSSILL